MATEFTQDAVLRFLCSKNGRVKNADLLVHFKRFIRDDENRAQNRELFKRFVNSVAVVKQEEGVSFVVLRKKYMGLVRYVGDTPSPKTKDKEKTANPKEALPREDSNRIPEKGQTISQTDLKVKGKKPSHVDNDSTQKNSDKILLAAGIVNNNTETVHIETNTNVLPSSTAEHSPPLTIKSTDNRPCTLKPSELHLQSNDSGETCEQVQTGRVTCEAVCPSSQAPDLTGVVQENICIAEQGPSKETEGQSASLSSSVECQYNEITIIVPEDVRWNNVQKQGSAESLQSSSESVSASRPLHNQLASNPRISSSTPCLLDCSESANNLSDYQLVAQSNGSLPRLNDRLRPHSRESSGEETLFGPQLNSLPLDNARSLTHASLEKHHHGRLSTSYGDLLQPDYGDSAWPQHLSKKAWSSEDSLNRDDLPDDEQGGKVRAMLRRAQEARLFTKLQGSERKVGPLHHSMGNLDDSEPEVSPASSGTSTPVVTRRGTRRTRSQLRSRMCRSLGADLDQPFLEDGVSARLNRLHLLSSTMSFHYSTPPRMRSSGDVSSQGSGGGRVPPFGDGSGFRTSMVPLDPKEHDWMVKAAAGTWPDIYSLFRDEPGLLTRRDFISGYTVLHWIAKHGDHRVLNTLWYGVNKMGMNLDVDAKTTCGYTPLHLAAIHGHKKLIRLLVHKFKANVALRDTSGKKPWHYVGKGGPRDILQLLGAPLSITGGYASKRPVSKDKLTMRPVTSSPKVKRHSSIAAFLKHKSLLKVSGHPESFV